MTGEQPVRSRGLFSRLGPGLTAFLAVDVVLVVIFAVVLVAALRGGDESPEPVADPTPESSPEQTPDEDAEDVGALQVFVLPSGNIHCEMTERSATCTILGFGFERPTPPDGCEGTAGNVLSVEAGDEVTFPCVEGEPPSVPDGAVLLDYGEQSTVGEMTCNSSENGVLCRHNPTGKGFSLAYGGYVRL